MSAAEKVDFAERRREPRQHVGKPVLKLDPGNGVEPIACVVCDISERGARLELSADVELSKAVTVIIGNVRKDATVVWRKDGQMGIEFAPE